MCNAFCVHTRSCSKQFRGQGFELLHTVDLSAHYSPRFGARISHHIKLEGIHPGAKPAEVRSQAVAGFTDGDFDDRSEQICLRSILLNVRCKD